MYTAIDTGTHVFEVKPQFIMIKININNYENEARRTTMHHAA